MILRIFACVLASGLLVLAQDGPAPWTRKADMPTARTGARAAVLGGDIYLIGGMTLGELYEGGRRELDRPVDAMEAFNPAANKWKTCKPVPATGSLGAAAAGGKLYTFVGERQETFRYDPAADQWTPRSRMPVAQTDFGAAALGGRIYLVGGGVIERGQGINNTAAVWEYDPQNDRWTARAAMAAARHALTVIAAGGRIYAIGGVEGNTGRSVRVESYDPATNAWTRRADLPAGVAYAAAVEAGGKIVVFGGTREAGPMQVYDMESDRWSLQRSTVPRRIHTTAAGLDGHFYFFGGLQFETGRGRVVPFTEEITLR